jgi:hypothetical protein
MFPFFLLLVLAVTAVLIVKAPAIAANMKAVAIAPSESHEDCYEVGPGQKLVYSFESSKPVAFSIHYHKYRKMVVVKEEKELSKYKGEYAPTEKHEYCLMWTNNQSVPVFVNYTKSVSK